MNTFVPLALVFLLLPIVELYLLLRVGAVIGAFPTLVLVLFTAVLGSFLVRRAGLATFLRARATMAKGEVPAVELLEAMVLLVSGLLLITPGFVTDSLGFVLLVPAVRRHLISRVLRGVLVTDPNGRSDQARIIRGEYRREED